MNHWQVTLTSAAGQVMTFGLQAPDETSAFQRALVRIPFAPEKFTVVPVAPRCQRHRVRHDCPAEQNT